MSWGAGGHARPCSMMVVHNPAEEAMKAFLIFIVVLWSFLAVPFAYSQMPPPVPTLSATMQMKNGKQQFDKDEPILFTYTITNDSDKKVYVLKWGTPLEGFMSNMLDVRTAGGAKIGYEGFLVSRVGPLPEDYVEIDAGKSITVELPLHEGYKILDKNDYIVKPPQKMVLDVIHKKPVPGEVIKRNFVPAKIKLVKNEVPFQTEKRTLKQMKKPAPGGNPQGQPGTPGAPAAPHNLRQINEVPYLPYRYGLQSGLIRYAEYIPNEKYEPLPECTKAEDYPLKCDIQSRKTIEDENDRREVRLAFMAAYKMAAESKVIMNAGEGVARKAGRFVTWFGPDSPPASDGTGSCGKWTAIIPPKENAFSDRFASVRSVFGGIYSRFYDTDETRTVRFFRGPKSGVRIPEEEAKKDYTEAVKAVYPCDYRSVVAYVFTGDQRPIIYLCDSFFNPPDNKEVDKAGAIIHELSHLASTGFSVDDWAYAEKECKDVARCMPDEATENADNYHLFASNPGSLGLGLTPGQLYAHFRTAGGYYLSAGAGGTLNAANSDSSLCSNCTFILEALETTGTATSLKTGQTVRLLTIDRQNALSATGRIVQTDSTSQESFWIKKKGSGASTVVGEITTGDEIYLDPVTGGARLNVTTGAGNKNDLFIIELAR
jgi:hypothetical protein